MEAATNTKEQATSVDRGTSRNTDTSADCLPDTEAQAGVIQAEAITLVWTRKSLILAYILYVYLGFGDLI